MSTTTPPSSLRVRGQCRRLSHPLTTLSHPTPVTPGEASPNPFPQPGLGEGRAGGGRRAGGLSKNISLHPPQGLYQFSVVETAGPGTLVGRLRAQDPDLGDNALMAYSILDGEGSEAFSISTDSQGRDGLLTVRKVSASDPLIPTSCPTGQAPHQARADLGSLCWSSEIVVLSSSFR